MMVFGILLMIIGVIATFSGMGYSIIAPGSLTVNFGLIADRLNILLVGGFSFLSGSVFFGASVVSAKIDGLREPSQAAPQSEVEEIQEQIARRREPR